MIGRIKGTLIESLLPHNICIDVQGLGYELQVPANTFYRLPEIGEGLSLYTHMVVREDAQLLYGFYEEQERALFRALIRINGVGPKLALAILSGMEANELVRVVLSDNIKALESIPGIGKKTAQRLIIELRDRVKEWRTGPETTEAGSEEVAATAPSYRAWEEAESALVSLGYKPKEAADVVRSVSGEGLSSQELIRQALKVMVRT